MNTLINKYIRDLGYILEDTDWEPLEIFADELLRAVSNKKQVFLCGNGGSAGNAMHLANDFVYGVNPAGGAIRAEALSANSSVLTCLGNDIGYESIFSHQLQVKADEGDILIVLSGSGNSPNIISALEKARELGVLSFALLGYSGGKAKELADSCLHFDINDMQIAEDTQLVAGHLLMRHLNQKLKG